MGLREDRIVDRDNRRENAIIYIQLNPIVGTFIEELRQKTLYGKFLKIGFSVEDQIFNEVTIRFYFRLGVYPVDNDGSTIKVINYNYAIGLEKLNYEAWRNHFYNELDFRINELVKDYSMKYTFESLTFKTNHNPVEML